MGAGVRRRLTIVAIMIALLMIALLPATVRAQEIQHGVMQSPGIRTDLEKKYDTAIDKAYQDTIKKTGKDAAKSDPWQAVRPTDADNAKR
jgi:hypothetical protein